MEKVTTKRLALYTGRTHPALAQEVAQHLDIEVGSDNLVEFANGEVRCSFGESVRGTDVFIMQTHYGVDNRSVNDSIMEQLIMIERTQARICQAHHSCSSVLRLRPPRPKAPRSRANFTPALWQIMFKTAGADQAA